MIPAKIPDNEQERLARLRELEILDTIEEQAYDDLTQLAAQICDAPIALVSLVDADRQWFKSHRGLDARQTPRELAFCAHAINGDELFMVQDSAEDERFHDNPLATGAPHVRFYAGAPLVFDANLRLGTLCVIDHEPRQLTDGQKSALEALARQVVGQLKLRLKLREMERLDRAKDEFISMVSHELRTPLTSINGSLGLLRSHAAGNLAPQVINLVDIAHRNGERLVAIVNDILDMAKLEAGKVELSRETLDAAVFASQAVELNKGVCEKCGCQIVVDIRCKRGVRIDGDALRLHQVLSNLISNAAKFSPHGATVAVRVEERKGQVVFSVIDHGPGIPREAQDKLFRRFSQITLQPNQKLPGTGLGLNICKRLVELHGGTIGMHSHPHQETVFHFALPRVK